MGVHRHRRLGPLAAVVVPLYRESDKHPRVNAAELAHIRSDPPDPPAHVLEECSRTPAGLGVHGGKISHRSVLVAYLFWILIPQPQSRHRSAADRPPAGGDLSVADIGSIGGGWLSSRLIKRGWSERRPQNGHARLRAGGPADDVRVRRAGAVDAVALIWIAAAAHQGWSANLFTLVSDTFLARPSDRSWGLAGWPVQSAACDRQADRISCCRQPELCARVPDCVVCLPDRARRHPSPGAEAGARRPDEGSPLT